MRWSILMVLAVATPVPAAAASARASDTGEQVVCKRQLETGTLAKFTKLCMTKTEWQRLRERSQATGQNLRDRNFSSCATGGNTASRSSEALPAC